jgi:hypothetical protein
LRRELPSLLAKCSSTQKKSVKEVRRVIGLKKWVCIFEPGSALPFLLPAEIRHSQVQPKQLTYHVHYFSDFILSTAFEHSAYIDLFEFSTKYIIQIKIHPTPDPRVPTDTQMTRE